MRSGVEGIPWKQDLRRHVSAGWGDGIRTWTMVRRTHLVGSAALGCINGHRGRQNGNPGEERYPMRCADRLGQVVSSAENPTERAIAL